MEMATLDRITRNPAVMGGKPCIRGMRVTAGMVVGLVASGHSWDEILNAYPYLEREDIRQALAYAAWRVEEVEIPLPTNWRSHRHEPEPVVGSLPRWARLWGGSLVGRWTRGCSDAEIFEYASTNGLVVLTHDLDFGTMLAVRGAASPSVVQIRSQDVLPKAIGEAVVLGISAAEMELEQGALLTIDAGKRRIRILPIRWGASRIDEDDHRNWTQSFSRLLRHLGVVSAASNLRVHLSSYRMRNDFLSSRVPRKFDDPPSQVNLREDLRKLEVRAAFVRNYRMNREVPGAPELDPVLRFHLGLDQDQKKKAWVQPRNHDCAQLTNDNRTRVL
jgi:uncharacterized protein (DUF433 family)/predicted nuclease of predicted toxin-antitoxin system